MAELSTILADGFDREAFERALGRSDALGEVVARLAGLLPHAEPLVGDIFFALFKLNAVLQPEKAIAPSVLINHGLVRVVLESGSIEALRRHTALDESRSAAATVLVARRLLDSLRREFRRDPNALLDAAEAAHNQDLLQQRQEELRHLKQSDHLDQHTRETLNDELRKEVKNLQARLRRDRKRQREVVDKAEGMADAVEQAMEQADQQLKELQSMARGLGVGQSGQVDVERRLELGERIMRDPKLVRLARLVGAMRELAFEARRRRAVRSPQETHSIATGNDLERILPSELGGLRSARHGRLARLRRADFLRRLVERQLLQYRLEAPSARGPMVVCLDGSGSMQGSKELWAKAVALTLMEIARRERRRCLGLIFSSGAQLFEVELLGKRAARGGGGQRAEVRDEDVLRFAEYFPGGGTDFGPPLERALEAVTEGDYRRGDIVFISDGQAPVSDKLLDRVRALRKRHRFRIRAILVDVSAHERDSIAQFADEIHAVTDLASTTLESLYAGV